MKNEKIIKTGYVLGSILDILFGLLMVAFPSFCLKIYGFQTELSPTIRFWIAYPGSIIFFWTALLIWGMRKPQERKFIALITILIVFGFMLIQICGILFQVVPFLNMVWLLIIQLLLISILGYGYYKV
ncbi:MAG: hypothetical protein PVI26_14740 [Chitinispirillia bacterium]